MAALLPTTPRYSAAAPVLHDESVEISHRRRLGLAIPRRSRTIGALRNTLNTIASASQSETTENSVPASSTKKPWWFPIFDRIFSLSSEKSEEMKLPAGEEEEQRSELRKERVCRGALTAEKAKKLRKEMRATDSFHDVMYHSAIASRLATPSEE